MTVAELLQLIEQGENSGVAVCSSNTDSEQLAKAIVALANLYGGRVLLGVEDDGRISGLSRDDVQEWVFNCLRNKVTPQILPSYEEVKVSDGVRVAVITVGQGISKPYMLKHSGREDAYIRMGNRSELATREQQLRLFQAGGLLHVEAMPVSSARLHDLDLERIRYHIQAHIGDQELPQSPSEWHERLIGLGMMVADGLGSVVATVAGVLLFGIRPRRFLPQAGLRIQVYTETDKTSLAKLDRVLDGPLVGRWQSGEAGTRTLVDPGLIESCVTLLDDHITFERDEIATSFRRTRHWHYPREAVREVILNALAHRDWTRSVDIEVLLYADRMAIISPGRLPNSMTVAKMLAGLRTPRNPMMLDILRDYGYVEARGMGIRRKVLPLMRAAKAPDPLFEADEDQLRTVLYRARES